MKKKTISLSVLTTFFFLLLTSNSFGQFHDVKWEPWQTMPCYQGISVSVINMGYGKEAGGYLWGIRIRNDYTTPVRLSFKLTIGEENKTSSDFRVTGLLKKGDIWTDGGDVFTANLFKSPSKEYFVVLDKVCFDGMKCGGKDECYADCDATPGKPNQPCGLNDNVSNKKPTPPKTEEWQEVFKGQQKAKTIKMEDGLKWTVDGQDFLFKKGYGIGVYTYTSGSIEAQIVFMNESQLGYSFKNLTDSSYKDIWYKRISSTPINKKVFSGKTAANFEDCVWQGDNASSTNYRLTKTDAGYLLSEGYNFEYNKRLFSEAGENQYQYVEKSGGMAADVVQSLSIVNDYRFEITYSGGQHPGSPIRTYKVSYFCLSALDDWVNVKDNSIMKLAFEEGGVLFNGSGYILFYPGIAKDTYQIPDGPCNPCYKTTIRFTDKNSFSVDYTNLQGQINRTDNFVRRNK